MWFVADSLRRLNWKWVLLIAVGVTLVAFPRVTDLGAFVAFDEPLYWRWTNQFFQALVRRDWAATLVGAGRPAITLMLIQSLGLMVRYFLALLSGESSAQAFSNLYLDQDIIVFNEMTARRLPMTLLNVVVVLWLLFLVYRQFGHKVTVVSAILLGLDPFLLSDSRTMRADALMSVLMTVSALGLLIYVAEGRRRYLLLSGFTVGLAFANKFSALAMAPFVLVMAGVLAFSLAQRVGWRRGVQAGLVCLAIWGGMSILILWAIWPALWVVPGKVFDLMLPFIINTTLEGRSTFFMGQMYTNQLLPFFYVVTIPLRLSPLVMIGLIAGLFALFSRNRLAALRQQFFRQKDTTSETSVKVQTMLTAGALITYVISVWLVATVGILKRDHYVMPIFPALDILGAVGLVWLIRILANRLSERFRGWQYSGLVGIGLSLILVVQMAVSIPHHPYYYSYYNPLIFGSRWAPRVTMINWGPGLGEAAHYINTRPDAERLKVASPTVRKFIPQIKGTVIRFVYGQPWIQADYLVVPFEDVQLNKIAPAYYDYATRQRLAREVILGSIPFAWVYEGPAAEHFADSKLDGLGLLLGYNLDGEIVPAGGTVLLKLFWQNDGAGTDDLFFVRLSSADGYVWAEELVEPLPNYEKAALTDEAIVEGQAQLVIPLGTPPGTYFLQSGVYSRSRQETLGLFTLPAEGNAITVTRPSSPLVTEGLTVGHRLDVSLTSEVSLLGFDLVDDTLVLNEENQLALWWQAQARIKRDYVVSLQLLDSLGEETAYWLGRPVLSGYPTNQWQAREIVHDPWRLNLPAELLPGDYTLQLTLYDTDTETQVSRIKLGRVSVVTRRRQFVPPNMDHLVDVSLDDRITLLGYDLVAEPIARGGRLRVTLYWQAQEAVKDSYTVFVQLLKPDGTLAAQHDGPPANGAILTNDWAVGEVVTDRHQVEFANLPPGDYTLVTGMYHPTTGERLPTSSGDTAIRLQALPIGQ